MYVATLDVKRDNMEALTTRYPDRSAPLKALLLANVAWFVQCIMIPMALMWCLALLMATSSDTSEVIMNGLAITSIIDIDNMMYEGVLSAKQRIDYENIW